MNRISKLGCYVGKLAQLQNQVDECFCEETDQHLQGLPFPQIAQFDASKTRRRIRKERSDLALYSKNNR